MKPYTLEKAYEDINKCHDFWKMVDYYKSYDESYCKSSPDADLGGPSNTRRHFNNQKKAEMRLHYSTTGNFCETARAFNLNESTVRGIIKTLPVAGKIILSKKQNFPGAGRPSSYLVELEDQLIKWILVLRDLNFPVSILALQEKAKNLIQPGNPEFKAIRGWIEKFFSRHKLSLRSRTSVSQKLPSQLESVLTKFYADAAKFMRIRKYPLSLVGNMDETPPFLDMVPSKCIAAKGTKECVVRISGGEKKHLTVVLSATLDGKMLLPMTIFKTKTGRTISDLNIPTGFIVKAQEKAWMDDDLMKVWVEDIWIKHVRAECQKLGFENALSIPAGCTSKCQPMDVCLNKPFKAILRKCWVNYISSVVETSPDASQDPSFKILTPTRQQMVD